MNNIHNVLVVDDSIATGKAMKKCRELLKDIEHLYNIQYCVIFTFLHGPIAHYYNFIQHLSIFFQSHPDVGLSVYRDFLCCIAHIRNNNSGFGGYA